MLYLPDHPGFSMKYVSLIRRRADLSRKAFRDYYEQVHAPLALQFFPPQLYQRNHLSNPVDEQPFDCLSEFDYADDFDPMQVLATEAGAVLAKDERNFMDRDSVCSARALLLRSHLPAIAEARQRQLWLFGAGAYSQTAIRQQLQAQFEQLLAQLSEGQGASLYWLEPYYCETFPYTALLTLEGTSPLEWPVGEMTLAVTRLQVNSCPSAI